MEFFGYDTCDKLIWTSGEGNIITNKISKKGITKTHNNKISLSSTLGFGCSLHKDTCDILSEDLVSSKFKIFYRKRWNCIVVYKEG